MKSAKKFLAGLLACIMLLSITALFPFASEKDFVYIEGENIPRGLNMAVIYRNVKTTNQNQWGHDIVIDKENKVTDIVEAGDLESNNLAVPEGGAVVSASGTKVEWFEDNIDVGDIVFYDEYTKKLFVCDSEGEFDPFFTKTFEVKGEDGKYIIVNPEIEANPQYSFDIAVDKDGNVIARGGGVTAPEDGFTVSAPTSTERAELLMFAPIGAKCEIDDNTMTLSFDEDMLEPAIENAVTTAKAKLDSAKKEFLDIDFKTFGEIIDFAEENIEDADYKTYSKLLNSLENEINAILSENSVSELRGAFHTPDETNETEVRATVTAAKAAGLNTLILRVTNGYGTFIPLPEGSKFRQDEKFGGFDVLQAYINICKTEKVGLSLCIETYYNEFASVASPEWLSQSNGEESYASKYFSPASAEFKVYFLDYVDYIISNYDIKNIMFDYLRYPKFRENADIGYDYNTMQMFSSAYNIPITEVEAIKTELFSSKHWDKWVDFKTGLVNDMAKSLSDRIREKRSDITVTAVAERDTVDHFYMQNARYWIESGWFEGLCLAVFEADADENDPLPENGYYDGLVFDKGEAFTVATNKNAYFFAGLESDSSLSANALGLAINDSRRLGADGFIFSSLDGFIARNYTAELKYGELRGSSVSPFIDSKIAMKTVLEYSKNKFSNLISELEGCDDESLTQAYSLIDKALKTLETKALTVKEAEKLENDMAILFASAPAKAKILREFAQISKLSRLAKEEIENEPESDNSSEESTSSENDESTEESVEDSVEENPIISETVSELSETESNTENTLNIDVGSVLIYGFVGLTIIAVIAAMVVGIRRTNKKPEKHYMPKGSAEGYENKDNVE